MTVFISLWHQVDYRNRSLLPWHNMRKEPTSAKDSLCLDYVSPDPITCTLRALRNKHWVVVATVFGWGLLKLAVRIPITALCRPSY